MNSCTTNLNQSGAYSRGDNAHAEVILVGDLVEEGGNTETVAFSGCRSGRDVVEAKQTLGRDLVVARSGDLLTPGAAPLGRTRDVRNLERRLGAGGGLDEPGDEWSIGHLCSEA